MGWLALLERMTKHTGTLRLGGEILHNERKAIAAPCRVSMKKAFRVIKYFQLEEKG